MKIVHCQKCRSMVSLAYETKSCACGLAGGRYLDDGLCAVYFGPKKTTTPLGIANPSFYQALKHKFEDTGSTWGKDFTAWRMHPKYWRFRHVPKKEIERNWFGNEQAEKIHVPRKKPNPYRFLD